MALTECGNGHLYNTDQYVACPYCNNNMGNRIDFNARETVAPEAYRNVTEEPKENRTVPVFEKRIMIETVVGWLVCIEGVEKGKDYQIGAKNNTIGRGEEMDIRICGDETISRENHARLSYDPKHNDFYIIPAENVNNIYLNDEPVYIPTKLSAYDLLELGESKFAFIPFCSDRFNWEEGLK